MATITGDGQSARAAAVADFDRSHPNDRSAVLVGIGLLWFGLLAGFLPDMAQHFATPSAKPYELVTHLHAALSFGWMLLLSWQMIRVRSGDMAGHRANGRRFGPFVPPALVLTAIGTIWASDRAKLALDPDWPVQRMATQLGHLIPFAILTAAALLQTRRPGAHKRLLIMAMAAVLDTGLTRWMGEPIITILGDGPAGQTLSRFPLTWGMLALLAAYDLSTRQRLHPQFVPAAVFILATEAGSIWLYFQPWWPAVARGLLGV